jgi:hypothetical protein
MIEPRLLNRKVFRGGIAAYRSDGRAAATPGQFDVLTSRRYNDAMEQSKRATIYFDPSIHRALRLKAAACDRSISDMVNESLRISLAEDAEDLEAFEERRSEPSVSFESVVRDLRKRGRI